MSGEFLGTYENSVHKMRVIIPAPLKNKFATSAKSTVVCTVGLDKSIVIYPLDNWIKWKEMQKTMTDNKTDISLVKLMRFFAATEQKLEGPGRIRLTEELLDYSGIVDSVIIKGEGDFISLWEPANYKKIKKERLQKLQNYKPSDYGE